MSDLIDRQAAIEAFEKFIHEIGIEDAPYNYGEIALCEANVPSAEKVGKWIEVENKWGGLEIRCSECGAQVPRDGWGNAMQCNYCPNCGARMEGEDDE